MAGVRTHCASVKDYTAKLVKQGKKPKHSLPPMERQRTIQQWEGRVYWEPTHFINRESDPRKEKYRRNCDRGGKKDRAVHLAVCTETKVTANGGRDDKKNRKEGAGGLLGWQFQYSRVKWANDVCLACLSVSWVTVYNLWGSRQAQQVGSLAPYNPSFPNLFFPLSAVYPPPSALVWFQPFLISSTLPPQPLPSLCIYICMSMCIYIFLFPHFISWSPVNLIITLTEPSVVVSFWLHHKKTNTLQQ